MVTIEKCCETVADILRNLRDSDFVSEFGSKAVDGLEDYGVDMAVNIFTLVNEDEEYISETLQRYEPAALKADYFA